MIRALNHCTVLTDDLDVTLDFYIELLGLESGPRPDLGFPGAWLYAGGTAVLHIVAGRKLPEQRAGVLDHVAFTASGLAGLKAKLDARKLPYELRRLPGSGLWQLFCHDPNGARVELDFDPSEAP
jgi:catechol 2,3-dioxygenase-like lactoylglutathione lyase family enzyme